MKKATNRRYPAETITDTDNIDDLGVLKYSVKPEFMLRRLKHTVTGINH